MPFIVQVALLVLEDPKGHEDLIAISKLGHGGAFHNTVRRDLWQRLLHFPLEAAIYTIRLPVKLSGLLSYINYDLIYPHAIFAELYERSYTEFARRFMDGDPGNLEDFWESQVDHPSYARHPIRDRQHADGLAHCFCTGMMSLRSESAKSGAKLLTACPLAVYYRKAVMHLIMTL